MRCQILGNASGGGFHAGFSFVPSGRADFAVLFGELEGVDHSQHFVNVAAERQIVNDLVTNHTLLVDQEGATEGYPGSPEFNVVGLADFVFDVGDQRVFDLADTAVIDRSVLPCQMGELLVDRNADDLDAA